MELEPDRDRLIAALRQRGVDYLAPSDAQGEPLSDEALIAGLAASDDARLRQALIALFLLRPELAPRAIGLRGRLAAGAEAELLAHYMAAAYLQRMWRVRLRHYLPPFAELPDYFSRELGLPASEDLHGKAGLAALAEWHSQHSARRANHLSEYLGVADLVLEQLRLEARRVPSPTG